MHKQISSILVPVDFTENSKLAISKAMELCPLGRGSTIHLFHVLHLPAKGLSRAFSGLLKGVTLKESIAFSQEIIRRLESLQAEIEQERDDIQVCCWVDIGNRVQPHIIKKAIQLGADLIIIGKRSHHSVFPFLNTIIPGKLAMATSIPVLVAKQGSFQQKIKNVVIPIYRQSPLNKLKLLAMLEKKTQPHIRLVIFKDDNADSSGSRHLLLDAFRLLKSQSHTFVNYEILEGRNRAKALLKYCRKVSADVLIVYPGPETRVSSLVNSHISDLIPAESKTQVLAMTPG